MARSTSTSQARTSTTVARKAAVKPPAEASTKASTKAKTMAAGKRSAPAAKPAATVAAPKVGKATSVAKAARPARPAPGAPVEAVHAVAGKSTDKAASAPLKAPKLKLVRDSFTMPEDDYATIAAMKKRAIGFQRPARKSELLRAGLRALAALDDAGLKAALDSLVPVKAGRPKKH